MTIKKRVCANSFIMDRNEEWFVAEYFKEILGNFVEKPVFFPLFDRFQVCSRLALIFTYVFLLFAGFFQRIISRI